MVTASKDAATRSGVWAATVVVLAALVLGGCDLGRLKGAGDRGQGSGLASLVTPGNPSRDVEAPEVFQTRDRGLWDGRPSLGGVWVAHPDVTEPERVVIRNASTGRSVTGALFKRERETPGPTLQVSSDAAEALGMLAGQPAELDVVALRRAESEAGPRDAQTPAESSDPSAKGPANATPPEAQAPEPAATGLRKALTQASISSRDREVDASSHLPRDDPGAIRFAERLASPVPQRSTGATFAERTWPSAKISGGEAGRAGHLFAGVVRHLPNNRPDAASAGRAAARNHSSSA